MPKPFFYGKGVKKAINSLKKIPFGWGLFGLFCGLASVVIVRKGGFHFPMTFKKPTENILSAAIINTLQASTNPKRIDFTTNWIYLGHPPQLGAKVIKYPVFRKF